MRRDLRKLFENCASVSQNWSRIIGVSFRKP
jgi:hypothetical protein